MSSTLSLQTPPSRGVSDVTALSPALRVMMRHGNLALLLSFLDIPSVLRLMSVQRFAFMDKELALKAVLSCMLRLMPELKLEAWHDALGGVERGLAIPTINGVYRSFVLDTGPGMSRNLSHPSSCRFLQEWMEEADPRQFRDLLMSGFFSSRAKRALLIRVIEHQIRKLASIVSFPIIPHWLAGEQRLIESCRVLVDIAKNSFTLEVMTVNGRAWANTGMDRVPPDPRLYVSVSREYVERMNVTMGTNVLVKRFEYGEPSGLTWDNPADGLGFNVQIPSPPLTHHNWHHVTGRLSLAYPADWAFGPGPVVQEAPWTFETAPATAAAGAAVAGPGPPAPTWTDSESL